MAGHIDIEDLRGENPFEKPFEVAKKEIKALCLDFEEKHDKSNSWISVGEFKILAIQSHLVRDYCQWADRVYIVRDYPMTEDWYCASVEVHYNTVTEQMEFQIVM